MSEHMVRKQIYLPKQQNQTLKRLAKQRGISEAEVIRQALDREAELAVPVVHDSHKALENIFAYVESLRNRPEFMQDKPYKFNREELYEERESRWVEPKGN
jgi:5-formyltetrahydrofolate cyclo-ligase